MDNGLDRLRRPIGSGQKLAAQALVLDRARHRRGARKNREQRQRAFARMRTIGGKAFSNEALGSAVAAA
ncbi:MAG: hypothetical protein JOY90_34390 [Bradyrhizobium sp.]|uniref:hypothetical protein n=1 Tax=Bradyrhizobium sp. TaxID=376 RepID=UPI001DB73B5E|nr:hypothetical protein [Bradyrhizobium sp.]MBV9565503.1 hypothetical protein [Bradyrhizobium sp.]